MAAALADLHTAAELQMGLGSHPVFNYALGVVLANQREWMRAREAFTAAIRAAEAEGRRGSILILAFHERAKTRQLLGDARGALEDFNEVIRAQPDNRHALIRRAFALKVLGQFETSSRDWQRAKSLDGANDANRATLDEAWMRFEIPFVELCLPGEEDSAV
ncbi:unnamed protein product [Phytomonas sp. EM1]|nr:unnamed protein product [Phytomonas sp. EM1]|eukprot:CCW64095.1 unnamed protein product [Phytomonas sp. isolate EM1]